MPGPRGVTAQDRRGEAIPRPGGAALALDTAVVGFALWTLLYHAALLIGGWAASTTAMAAALAGVLLMLVGWHGYRLRRRGAPGEGPVEPTTPVVVIAASIGAAALSLIANRPDADDVFYVNRSSAVEALGVLPLRDTMYGDQVFAMIPGQYPPVASFEALLGTIAAVFGVPAASITYYVVPPLGSILAILALWRLLAGWDVRRPQVAFVVALTYLAFGGAFHASFGNTWIERMWQGKILFISILVPTLLVYLVRCIRWGRRSDAALATAAAIAGVGLTSTAIYLLPIFFAVGAIATLLLGAARRALPMLVPIGYLVVIGLVWLLLSGVGETAPAEPGADPSASLAPTTADIVTKVLGTGPYLIVGLLAALLGWVAIRERHARVLVLLLVATAALVVSPLGLAAMDVVNLPSSIRWRMLWLVPVPALLGAFAAGAGSRLGRAGATALGTATAVGVALVGTPLWSPANGVTLGWPSWKWADEVQREQEAIAAVAEPGDIIGVAEATGGMIAAVSGDMWSVNPRSKYTPGMADQAGFCAEERFAVARYAAGRDELRLEVQAALDALGVTVIAVPDSADIDPLVSMGFRPTEQSGVLRRETEAEPTCTPR